MASESDDKIETLVVDSAGFLKNIPLQNIARNIFTINEVINEIRSRAVRERLAVLPYEINYRVPSNESLHVVSDFAKKTGDFSSLSVVDLKVLALTYQLYKEKCGREDLRLVPKNQVEVIDKQQHGNIPGFFVRNKGNSDDKDLPNNNENIEALSPNDKDKELAEQVNECSLSDDSRYNGKENIVDINQLKVPSESVHHHNDFINESEEKSIENDISEVKNENNKNVGENESVSDGSKSKDFNDKEESIGDKNNGHDSGNYNKDVDSDGGGNHDSGDDSDDEGDWITPGNIGQVKEDMGIPESETRPTNVVVGCLTTDFAMQNILIQMGLHVISVDGMLIKEARSYVLKCYSCFKVTPQMQRLFCPKCGNRTLVKVSVSVDEEGVTRYHMPKRTKPFNIRGKKHPLPLPKGGRHSNNPLLFEDQLISQKRLPKVKDKVNVLDQDYVARSSPFAVNDTTSKAFNLGFHVHGKSKRNPNEAHKKARRKKK